MGRAHFAGFLKYAIQALVAQRQKLQAFPTLMSCALYSKYKLRPMPSMVLPSLLCKPMLRWRAEIGPLRLCLYLSLPVAFCSSLIENKMDNAVIKSCLGSWHVRVGRTVDGVLSFEEGWEEFVNHHGLKLGEILIFKHNGKRAFNVVAYEALGSEKRYDSKGKSPSEATASSTSRTSFVCTMKKSHGDPHKAYLIQFHDWTSKEICRNYSARFARSNGIVATSRIILKDPSGRSWPLILSRWESISRGSHRIAIRTNGWYKYLPLWSAMEVHSKCSMKCLCETPYLHRRTCINTKWKPPCAETLAAASSPKFQLQVASLR
ncbi:VERDANDI [Prunus dulcis]|uniref:VERDANDI n=1 Tax=Prunus dulcis TaxID=3755 RepID=A0A4Y1QSY6_PRUDU|nr:VERDANDI [Prunus dulcis]